MQNSLSNFSPSLPSLFTRCYYQYIVATIYSPEDLALLMDWLKDTVEATPSEEMGLIEGLAEEVFLAIPRPTLWHSCHYWQVIGHLHRKINKETQKEILSYLRTREIGELK